MFKEFNNNYATPMRVNPVDYSIVADVSLVNLNINMHWSRKMLLPIRTSLTELSSQFRLSILQQRYRKRPVLIKLWVFLGGVQYFFSFLFNKLILYPSQIFIFVIYSNVNTEEVNRLNFFFFFFTQPCNFS